MRNDRGSKPIVLFRDRCTTHFRTYFSGDWDADWGITGLLTDPWPNERVGAAGAHDGGPRAGYVRDCGRGPTERGLVRLGSVF